MDPISSVDQLVFLLRQRLSERGRAGAASTAARPQSRGEAAPAAIDSARALAAIEGVDERRLKRAVLQNLLADQLGPHLINDAQFQQVVDRVAEAIEAEPPASQLLSEVIRQLQTSAR